MSFTDLDTRMDKQFYFLEMKNKSLYSFTEIMYLLGFASYNLINYKQIHTKAEGNVMKSVSSENKVLEVIKVVIVFFAMLLGNILLSTIAGRIAAAGIDIPFLPLAIVGELVIMLPAIIYLILKKENILDSLGFHKIRFSTVLLTLLLTVLSAPLYMCANALSQVFVPNTMVQASSSLTSGSVLSSLLVVAVIAPLAEEIAMRGFCFNRFRKLTSVAIAAFVSAVMFGILHMNINQMCYAIVLGVIFALANYASGSIWTSFIMHMTINGFGILMLYAMQIAAASAGEELAVAAETARTGSNAMLYTGIVLLIISIGASFLIKKVLRKIAANEGNLEAMNKLSGKKNADQEKVA